MREWRLAARFSDKRDVADIVNVVDMADMAALACINFCSRFL